MTEQYEPEARKKGVSKDGFKEAAREAAKDTHDARPYRVDLYVTTTGRGNPIHEYIAYLTPEELP